jgi:hypothetical protein
MKVGVKMADKKEAKKSNTKEKVFTKEQIITSSKFSVIEKHILEALLNSEALYSLEDAKELIKSFNERKVI